MLQWINQALNGKYELGSNIDASITNSWNDGKGWLPIGNSANKFTGTFDGLNSTIFDLYINRPSEDYIGLFGYTNNANIKNLGLENIDVSGYEYVGGLVGHNYYATISNSYVTGEVRGNEEKLGGLVGFNEGGTISNSYTIVSAYGDWGIGGIAGWNEYGTIENSYSIGYLNATGNTLGGLVGYLSYSTLKNSYYGGTLAFVGTGDYRGGIAGNIFNGTIENSYYDKTKNQNLFDEDDYGKSTNELQRFSTFSYWDIVEDPDIAKGYPILAWQENKDKSIWLIHSIPKEEPKEDNHEDIQKLVSTIEQSINSGLTPAQSSFNPIGSAPTPLADDAGGSDADDPSFTAPLGGIGYLSIGLAQNVQIINGGIKIPDEPMFFDEDNN